MKNSKSIPARTWPGAYAGFLCRAFPGAAAFAAAAACLLIGSSAATRAAGSQPLASRLPPAAKTAPSPGRLDPSTRLSLTLGLPLRNQTELNQLITDLSAPSSPRYHQFLSAAEFAGRFGPTEADYQTLANFARTNGLSVDRLHPNRTLLGISGTAADIERVFHVTLRRYQHPREPREFFAPESAPSIDLALPLLDVTGLDNYSIPRRSASPHNAKPSGSIGSTAGAASADSPGTYSGPNGSGPSGLYMGSDFRNAYAPGVTLTGVGQAVGLFEGGGYDRGDISTYESMAGLPQVPLTNVLLDNATGLVNSDINEVTGDIEMVVAMAPGLSQVIVYEALNNLGQSAEVLNRMATDDLAKQLSCSYYGFPETPLLDQVFRQFLVQGQSFFTASGDFSAYYPGNPPIPPCDSPYVTVVGGTELTTTTNGGAWSGETVWDTHGPFPSGSGGGVSATYPIPSWQQNVNMSLNQGSTTMRNIPDVAAVSIDIFGFIGGSEEDIGGTSFATPLWAGFTALVNQQAAANGAAPAGFLNPALYALASGPDYDSLFHDITTGNNTNVNSGNSDDYYAVPGYDLCTGWGSPGGRALIDALVPLDALQFSPENGLAFGGLPGGPFTPSPQALHLTNASATSLSWSLTNSAPWLQVSAAAGSLAAGSAADALAVSLTPAATNLAAGNYLAWIAVKDLGDGAVLNIPVTLTVAPSSASFRPPVITNQPASQFSAFGVPAVFTVGASGTQSLFFQWQFNNTNLADGPNLTGSSSSILVIENVSAANLGAYSVVVSNLAGATVSAPANLEFAQAPIITSQPVNQSVPAGLPATFSVTAAGGQPLSWQWLRNGLPLANGSGLSGVSSSTLVIPSATTNLAGTYSVIVSNSFGPVTSSNATLAISPPYFPGASLTTLYTFSGITDGRNPAGSLLLAADGAFYGVTGSGGANGVGEVFRVTTAGQLSVIHSFNLDDNGNFPEAGLTLGIDGALYGTTSLGGPSAATDPYGVGYGTIFRVTTNGVLTALHGFAGGGEGASPYASLTPGPDGSFYGTTSAGGLDGDGTVFSLTTNGVLTTLYSFTNGLDGSAPASPLTWAADGSLYGAAPYGGSGGAGTIFRITPAGQFSVVYTFSGGDDGSSPASALIPAPDGGFYGCAPNGGPTNYFGSGTVFEVYTNGYFNLIYAFTDGDDGGSPQGGLLLAPDGSLFGTTYWGGPTEATDTNGLGYGILFNLQTNGLLSIAASFGGENGTYPLSTLIFGPAGQIYGNTEGALVGNSSFGTIFRLNLPVGATNAPPVIISQPFSQTLQAGSSAVFTVDASGAGTPLYYQWIKNGTNLNDSAAISGTSSDLLTILDISAADAGTYSVLVSNAAGSVTSSNALLDVLPAVPPAISVQPASQNIPAGAPAVFTVTAAGNSLLSFQWLKNGVSLSPNPGVSGIASNVLTLPNISVADAGAYSVIVSDLQGSVTSSNALLTVISDNSAGVVLQTLYSFTNGNPSGLVRGPDGAIYGVTADGGPNAAGTLFRVSDTAAPTLLHTFTGGSDGANPSGRLIIGADGKIYGVTTSGGSNGGWGTIFKAGLDGTITTLHSFAGSDGAQPFGALVQNAAGNLYGTTPYGGEYGFGTLFEVTTNGSFSPLYSFGGLFSDGTVPLAGLAPGPGGDLYGTTSDGGAYQAGEIFKLDTNGVCSAVFSFSGTNGADAMELTPGPDGALYGVCIYGGPTFSDYTGLSGLVGNGLVFCLQTNGVLNTMPFNGTNGSNAKAALVLGADGNFYGTTTHGGPAGLGTVFRVQFAPTPAIDTLFVFSGANGANPESALVPGTNGDFYGTTFYGGANGQGTIFHLTLGAPPPPAAPIVTTQPATGVTGTSATLNGTVDAKGNVTAVSVAWGLSASLGNTNAAGILAAGYGSSGVSDALTGLTPGTKYYYSVTASNASGVVAGAVRTFTTPVLPVVDTLAPSGVTGGSVTLNGTVDPKGLATTASFVWGTTTNFGNTNLAANLAAIYSTFGVSNTLTGLMPGTKYYYALAASNAVGVVAGAVESFTTLTPPVVHTLAASGVTGTSATLNGTADPKGLTTTSSFVWGLSANFGNTNLAANLGAVYSTFGASNALTGLTPGTKYYYAMVASNASGVVAGAIDSFTTLTLPVVHTLAASGVTSASATLNGTVDPKGFATVASFVWGAGINFGNTNLATNLAGVYSTFGASNTLTGLMPGTKYYYAMVASNAVSVIEGAIYSFTTATLPVVHTLAATAVTGASATLNGTVDPKGLATTASFVWGVTTNFGHTNLAANLPAEYASPGVSDPLTGLAPGTKYYYTVVASNIGGMVGGAVLSFTTAGGADARQDGKLLGGPVAILVVSVLADGTKRIDLVATPGQTYVIEAAGDPMAAAWTVITTVTATTDGSITFTDPQSANAPSRFYRLRNP